MTVSSLDPLTDPRWNVFVHGRAESSIFHTLGWLRVLQASYGYKPIAFTTSAGGDLENGMVFCEVESWLTGRRLVSLPFSDHCQPLADRAATEEILTVLNHHRRYKRFRYIEVRPKEGTQELISQRSFDVSETHCFQKIDLGLELPALYKGFHDSCVRRKIKRAEREELTYCSGRSPELLAMFRALLLLTRRRHKVPPQPALWFNNLVRYLGENVTIHMALKEGRPLASILTLRHKQCVTYKYGCSDAQQNARGATPFLFWKVIQEAKAEEMNELDLGRSALSDAGLIAFKQHLGAASSDLLYVRSPKKKREQQPSTPSAISRLGREALTRLPDPLFGGVGELVYRHLG